MNIFEVGPRDGLQNEKRNVTAQTKAWFVQSLIAAGVKELELGAFVRPDRVPQMADTEFLYGQIKKRRLKTKKARLWSLVPNLVGLERAIDSGAKNIAVFTAATDSFVKKNINMTVKQSLKLFGEVVKEAKRNKVQVRGYVSTAFGCPFEGKVNPKKPLNVVEQLVDMGVTQVSIGDTIGVATPKGVEQVMGPAIKNFGAKKIAGHFHDTRGTALANALRAIDLGTVTLDSSAGGLGGCPFAPGATGNLATEDLVYMLHGMGIKTGINLEKLCMTSLVMAKKMKRPLSSSYLQAFASRQKKQSSGRHIHF